MTFVLCALALGFCLFGVGFGFGFRSHTFGASELVDLDAHGDILVAGDAVLGETDFGLTLNSSTIHMSSAICSLHSFRVLRHVGLSFRRPFSPQSTVFPLSVCLSVCPSSFFVSLPNCSPALSPEKLTGMLDVS